MNASMRAKTHHPGKKLKPTAYVCLHRLEFEPAGNFNPGRTVNKGDLIRLLLIDENPLHITVQMGNYIYRVPTHAWNHLRKL